MMQASGTASIVLRFFSMLVELMMSLGFPYGVVWVGGWCLAASYLWMRSGQIIRAVVSAAAALGFVWLGSFYVDLLPNNFDVFHMGWFVFLQIVVAFAIAAVLLWMRWVMLQRRTVGHIRLYAPLYLFPFFVLGVMPYGWLVSLAGQYTRIYIF